MIRIRVTAEQRRLLVAAAEKAGTELSDWLRSLGLRVALAPTYQQLSLPLINLEPSG
ncbi:MAG: plasmid mobilization protein [Polyangiales bacterium]